MWLLFQEIPLNSILGVESFKLDPSAEFPRAPHVFEIRVSNVVYYVGEDPFYGSEEGSMVVSTESGKGLEQARHWEHAIRQALMPVTPTSSINQGTRPHRTHDAPLSYVLSHVFSHTGCSLVMTKCNLAARLNDITIWSSCQSLFNACTLGNGISFGPIVIHNLILWPLWGWEAM